MISSLLLVYLDHYWPADLTCLLSVSFLFALLWELRSIVVGNLETLIGQFFTL